ncbi:Oxidoreductase NAD-binding domain-containing protein 1, partial [Pseudolycoriella hygida]
MTDLTTSTDRDHIQRTVNQHREPQTTIVEISSIKDLSPTVKHLVLRITEKPVTISFKAGQWVDMYIPGVDTVGGFSICSSPIHLRRTGELSLSVKASDHPPASW